MLLLLLLLARLIDQTQQETNRGHLLMSETFTLAVTFVQVSHWLRGQTDMNNKKRGHNSSHNQMRRPYIGPGVRLLTMSQISPLSLTLIKPPAWWSSHLNDKLDGPWRLSARMTGLSTITSRPMVVIAGPASVPSMNFRLQPPMTFGCIIMVRLHGGRLYVGDFPVFFFFLRYFIIFV